MSRISPSATEVPSVAKCKRVIRPLTSKIHGLIDYDSKHKFSFDFPLEKPVDSDNESYEDESYAEPRLLMMNSDLREYQTFWEPQNSSERLYSLRPFIYEEMYRFYEEIFTMFKSVMNTFATENEGKMLDLSTLAAFKVGRTIAMNSKPTHHIINRSKLFDIDLLPPDIMKLSEILADDIDEWLVMEPSVISTTYRKDLMIGYVLHFLVLNLQSLLYLLIPVLIHWLHEESKSRPKFGLFKTTLFHEFWTFDYARRSKKNDEERMLSALISDFSDFGFTAFWTLYAIEGYWGLFFDQMEVGSSFDPENHASLMLDCLPNNNYLNRKRIEQNLSKITIDWIQSDVYRYIRMCPQHPNINDILAITIGQIVQESKTLLDGCKWVASAANYIEQYYLECVLFVRIWLSFSADDTSAAVFNSLYSGNEEMFDAVIKLSTYFQKRCSKYLAYIQSHLSSASKILEAKDKLNSLKHSLRSFNFLLLLLKAFYLDSGLEVSLIEKPQDLVKVFQLCQETSSPNKKLSGDFNDFIYWLAEEGLVGVARHFFFAFYGRKSSYRNHEIDSIFIELFNIDS